MNGGMKRIAARLVLALAVVLALGRAAWTGLPTDGAAAAAAVAVSATEQAASPAPDPDPVVVVMSNNRFVSDFNIVPVGATVVWRNDEPDPNNGHDVYAEDGTWASPLILPGESWSFILTSEGYYRYYCDLHEDMWAELLVVEPASPT